MFEDTTGATGGGVDRITPTKNGGVEHRDGGAIQYHIETPNKNWCSRVN